MKLKFNLKSMVLVSALTIGMSLSLVSAKPHLRSVLAPAPVAAEAKVVGGQIDSCAATMGLATGLAIGAALSPCSILCAAAAWYVGIGGGLFACDL